MTRDVNGNYTLPLAAVITSTTITSAWGNTTTQDIAVALTDSLSRSGKGELTAVLKIIPGTESAPGLSFNNEVGTGFYRQASGIMSVSILGTKVFDWKAASINFVQKIVVADATASTTGSTGSINSAGGIGAVKDIVTD